MNRRIVLALAATTLALSAFTVSARLHAAEEKFRLVHVADLETLRTEKKDLVIFDANNPDFRKKNGVIPGAKMLSSFKSYAIDKELPAEKSTPIVFYCANTQCMASHAAAGRAADAGYTDVAVLADGLLGWKDAGKPVEKR